MQAENIVDIYTLSPTQQGILFHVLSAPDSGVYISQTTCILQGNLNLLAFEQAWQEVVNRHSALRTGFVWEGLEKPVQIVYREVKLEIAKYDWCQLDVANQQARLQDYCLADKMRGFDLAKPPLIRLTIIKIAAESYQLVWTSHHLVLDGWSGVILQKEVFAFYETFCNGKQLDIPTNPPFRDYITWLKQQDIAQTETFWRQTLQGFTTPTPLYKNIRNQINQPASYQHQAIYLSASDTASINTFARKYHLTVSNLVLGAWALLLSYYSGNQDVLMGKVMSGRPVSMTGVESTVGIFVNTLPARVQVSPEDSLLTWLQSIQSQQIQLHEYEHTPLVQIQSWSDVPPGVALFDSLLIFQNTFLDVLQAEVGSLTISKIHTEDSTNYPLTINVIPGTELCLKASYDVRCFHENKINRILENLRYLLVNMVNTPISKLNELINKIQANEKNQKNQELQQSQKINFQKLATIKPQTFRLSFGSLVKINYLFPDKTIPIVIQPLEDNLDLVTWSQNNLDFIEQKLLKHGAILFRDFKISSTSIFEKFMRVISPELLEYRERSTPRTDLGGNIYTSTEYPAHEHIALHNEFSYAYTWPMKICFYCAETPLYGGETPIADCRQFLAKINPRIKDKFIEKQVMYVRNYGNGIDLSWQEAFQTNDKSVVEDYCRQAPMEFEWLDENRLRTRQVRPSVAIHPKTQEMVWFNQAHLFHISNLDLDVREALLELFKESDIPRNTYYGDGSPIDISVLDEIREVYQQVSVKFPWQQGDVLLLDNMLVAHGRNPFVGKRKIFVAMGEAFTQEH